MLISRKWCKIEIYLQWKTNRKSYMTYQMAATAVALNDIEGHSPVAGILSAIRRSFFAAFYTISTDSVLARFLCIGRASCIICSCSSFVLHLSTHSTKQTASLKLSCCFATIGCLPACRPMQNVSAACSTDYTGQTGSVRQLIVAMSDYSNYTNKCKRHA